MLDIPGVTVPFGIDPNPNASGKNQELPLDAIEQLIRFAHEKLEPFEDGTPLSSAASRSGPPVT